MVKSTIDRIAGIVKSNVNELLDQIENPEKMVRQMIRDMDEAVDAAVATMCTAVANQRRLEREHANNTAKAGEFQQKANRAVASGDDELGRSVPPTDVEARINFRNPSFLSFTERVCIAAPLEHFF